MMLGYSVGAITIMDSLCGASERGVAPGPPLDEKYAEHIVASIFYGEESYVGGMPWNKGTCWRDAVRCQKPVISA